MPLSAAATRLAYAIMATMGFENGKLVRVVLRATLGDRQEVNTLHYDLIDDPLQPANDPQQLADDFRDDVIPLFAGRYNARWTIQPVVVVEEKDPLNPNDPRQEWTSGAATPGTATTAGPFAPSAGVVVASNRTEHIGRRFRGRTFIGGDRNQIWMEGNTWVQGWVDGCQALMDAIPRQPDLGGGQSSSVAHWCVYSRTQRAANQDPYASKIVSSVCSSTIHWLRRRENI